MSKQNYSVSESQAVRLKTMLNKEDFFFVSFLGFSVTLTLDLKCFPLI
jgi:hypothetical protein